MQSRIRLVLVVAVVGALMFTSAAHASRGYSSSATLLSANGVLTMTGGMACTVLLSIFLNSSSFNKGSRFANLDSGGSSITGCTGILAGRPNAGAFLPGTQIDTFSFTGTLPNITSLRLTLWSFGFLVNTVAGSCLFGGINTLTGVTFDVSSGVVRTMTFSGGSVPRSSGSALCPTTGGFTGTLTLTFPPTLTLI